MVEGIQSRGVGACLKHFAVNNQESHRLVVDAIVDERTLREVYLAGFEIAVKESEPWTVMCSYNLVNGVYASEHHELLQQILRDEWGFEGFVISDWIFGLRDAGPSVRAGLDVEMPYRMVRAQHLEAAIEREMVAFGEALRSDDAKAAFTAFLSKSKG